MKLRWLGENLKSQPPHIVFVLLIARLACKIGHIGHVEFGLGEASSTLVGFGAHLKQQHIEIYQISNTECSIKHRNTRYRNSDCSNLGVRRRRGSIAVQPVACVLVRRQHLHLSCFALRCQRTKRITKSIFLNGSNVGLRYGVCERSDVVEQRRCRDVLRVRVARHVITRIELRAFWREPNN